MTKRTYEKPVATHWDMLEKDLPVYTYAFRFLGGSQDYQKELKAHVLKKNSRIKYVFGNIQYSTTHSCLTCDIPVQ